MNEELKGLREYLRNEMELKKEYIELARDEIAKYEKLIDEINAFIEIQRRKENAQIQRESKSG